MNSFVARLINSVPTLSEQDSLTLIQEIFSRRDWILFSSELLGFDTVVETAHYFTSCISEVISEGHMSVRTDHPLHIFSFVFSSYKFIGLLYSNGAVVYCTGEDVLPLLFVFIDREIADALNTSYIDVTAKKLHNVTEEQVSALFSVGVQQPDEQTQEELD